MLTQQSLVAMADAEIRRLILFGELPPGSRLHEVKLSERLGISRPSLREALRGLAAARILEQTPRHGYYVAELTARDLEEIYGLRAALEEYALSLIVPRLAATELDGLTDIMAPMWRPRMPATRPRSWSATASSTSHWSTWPGTAVSFRPTRT